MGNHFSPLRPLRNLCGLVRMPYRKIILAGHGRAGFAVFFSSSALSSGAISHLCVFFAKHFAGPSECQPERSFWQGMAGQALRFSFLLLRILREPFLFAFSLRNLCALCGLLFFLPRQSSGTIFPFAFSLRNTLRTLRFAFLSSANSSGTNFRLCALCETLCALCGKYLTQRPQRKNPQRPQRKTYIQIFRINYNFFVIFAKKD